MSRPVIRTLAAALPLVLLLAGCLSGPPEAAVRRLALYKAPTTPVERVAGETGEAIDCDDRHAVCAELWLTRAEALLASVVAPLDLGRRLALAHAIEDAAVAAQARLPAAPDGADPGARMLRILKVRVRVHLIRVETTLDPQAQTVQFEAVRRLAGRLGGVPGGRAYATWFPVHADLADLFRTTAVSDLSCPRLLALRGAMPADPPPDIAGEVRRIAEGVDAAIGQRGCTP